MPNRKEQYLADMQAMIDKHGWMVQAVFAGNDQPGFAYTVGLAAKGLPELIVFSMPPGFARTTLNHLAHRMSTGETIPLNTRLTCVFDGADAQLVEANRELTDKFMYQALYRDPHYRALQLVWTDPAMLFPWEEGYGKKFVFLQPLLRPAIH